VSGGVKNKLIEDLLTSDLGPVEFPARLGLTSPLGDTGDKELTALFAGQSAALARDTTAGTLLDHNNGSANHMRRPNVP
jgi:hypothetical protein